MTIFGPSVTVAIANIRRSINRAGARLRARLGLLLAGRRTFQGGGSTLLPPGRKWKRHEGRRARGRHLRGALKESRTMTAKSLSELDTLEARYRSVRGPHVHRPAPPKTLGKSQVDEENPNVSRAHVHRPAPPDGTR
jgi:hypothetical protein